MHENFTRKTYHQALVRPPLGVESTACLRLRSIYVVKSITASRHDLEGVIQCLFLPYPPHHHHTYVAFPSATFVISIYYSWREDLIPPKSLFIERCGVMFPSLGKPVEILCMYVQYNTVPVYRRPYLFTTRILSYSKTRLEKQPERVHQGRS